MQNKTMLKILVDLQETIKEQRVLDKKIQRLNTRMAKTDPSKDQSTAKKIEKYSTQLHYLNESADLFSAASADPWQYVEDTIREAIAANKDGDDVLYYELCQKIGFEEVDQTILDEWIELRKDYHEEGALYGYRGERRCAELQMSFEETFDKLNMAMPFPDAQLEAYW